jgi:hypothetical protein
MMSKTRANTEWTFSHTLKYLQFVFARMVTAVGLYRLILRIKQRYSICVPRNPDDPRQLGRFRKHIFYKAKFINISS